jgi:hypothetical protein
MNVDVFIDDIWVKTVYDVPGDTPGDAEEYVREHLDIAYYAEPTD